MVASYITRSLVPAVVGPPAVEAIPAVMASILRAEDIGRVYSPNKATGLPNISGVAQVGSMLTADINTVADQDGDPVVEADITYTWFYGDAADYSASLGTGTTYDLEPKDVGNTIKVRASFDDGLGDPDMRVSGLTTEITGSPGEISRIEATIRSVTVSGGDDVTLSVDIYGLQNAKDNGIGNGVTFAWTVSGDEGTITHSDGDPKRVARSTSPLRLNRARTPLPPHSAAANASPTLRSHRCGSSRRRLQRLDHGPGPTPVGTGS